MFWEPIVGVFALSVSLLIHDLTPQEYRETGSLFASCVRRDDSMWIIELTDAECEAVLERAVVARLATCADSRPYIVPISVKYERAASDRFLYSFANLGQKVRWMRSNPLVCVEVDELGDRVHWTTVVITGRFEELDPVQHREDAARAFALLHNRSEWWLPAAARTPSTDLYRPIVYRIRIESMNGRRAARRPVT